jgi:hypothetical protein
MWGQLNTLLRLNASSELENFLSFNLFDIWPMLLIQHLFPPTLFSFKADLSRTLCDTLWPLHNPTKSGLSWLIHTKALYSRTWSGILYCTSITLVLLTLQANSGHSNFWVLFPSLLTSTCTFYYFFSSLSSHTISSFLRFLQLFLFIDLYQHIWRRDSSLFPCMGV